MVELAHALSRDVTQDCMIRYLRGKKIDERLTTKTPDNIKVSILPAALFASSTEKIHCYQLNVAIILPSAKWLTEVYQKT